MAYRADIEIAVRGAQELKRLQNEISATSKLVDGLNNYLENIGSGGVVRSINNLKTIVGDAAAAFDRVALNTDEAVIAARKYVTATNELNAELRERAALLKTVNEEERKNKLARAGIRETTQYAGPIGPGPASPVNSLVGQKSPVAERVQRTLRARQDELDLQQALLRLEQKSTAEHNKKVRSQEALIQGKREVLALLDQEAQRQKFLAGASGTAMQGPLAGPGAMGFPVALPLSKAEQKGLETEARKQQILERMAATRQQLISLTANLQRLDQNSAVAIADAERNQRRLNAAKERELQISKQGALIAGRFSPIGGAENIPGSPAARAAASRRGKEAASNAIIGGAFPLLFGQGMGAAVGGGLGGAAGGLLGGQFGFGLSLVGTALGQVFDTAAQAAADFTKELKETGDATGALEQALGGLDKGTRTSIQNLARSGQQAAAAKESFNALAQEIGVEQAEALKRAGEATTEWGKNFQTWLTKTYANIVILGEAINNNFPTWPGIQARTSVFDLVEGQPPSPINTEAQDRLENLTGENKLLERQVALSRLTADASIDQRLQLERQVALQQYVNEAVQLEQQLKQKLLSQQEYNLRLRQAELSLTREIFTVENAAQQARQRQAEEARQAAERAARAAEQAAKEQTRAYQESLQLQNQLSQTVLEEYSNLTRDVNEYRGIIAGYEKLNILLDKRLPIQEEILNYERAIARTSDAYAANQGAIEAIHDNRLSNLRREHEYLKANLTIQKERAVLEQTAAMTELARQNSQRRVTGQTEIDRLTTRLESPFEGEQMKKQMLLLDQYTRRMDELLPIQQRMQDLQRDIEAAAQTPGVFTEDQVNAKKAELAIQTDQLKQLQAELQIRDRLEQQLLRQQEIYARYGFIADEVSRALSDSITGLITGTTTVAEAFGRMFENIGKAFIDMATQMLAQKLIFSLFGSLLGGLGGGIGGKGLEPTSVGGNAAFMDRVFSTPLAGASYAEGGFVTGPTRALIGEGGEPEYVIPASKMRSAMSRYASGARGASVIPTSGQTESSDTSAVTSSPIDVRYTVERINNVEYVTADQFRAGMQQAAAQGAQRGEQRALRSLQQSTAIRSRVGIK